MSNEKKPILALNVYPVGDEEEEDYRIVASLCKGGLSLEFDSTVNEIRDFFTERREKDEELSADKKPKKLKSVPKAHP